MTEEQVLIKLSEFKDAIINLKESERELKNSLLQKEQELLKQAESINEKNTEIEYNKKYIEELLLKIDSNTTDIGYVTQKEQELSEKQNTIEQLSNDNNVLVQKIESLQKELDSITDKYKDFKSIDDCNSLVDKAVQDNIDKQNKVFEKAIEELKKASSDSEKNYKETIEKLKNESEEKNKKLNELQTKLEAIYKKEHTMKNPSSIPIRGSVKYRFGVTSSEVIEKVKLFIEELYDSIDVSLKIKKLNDPAIIKDKIHLTDKEYEIFIERLTELQFNGIPIMYAENGCIKTNFDKNWVIKFISEIV